MRWSGPAFLAATVVAAVVAPRAMMSPGDLIEGHRDLESDCFACHTPFGGPDARCVACHGIDAIDAAARDRPAFHASLAEPRCSACHTDHGVRAVREFRHALLREGVRATCGGCHEAPADALHGGVEAASCGSCHAIEGWKPATFDHAAYFRFDRDHPADCASCHPDGFREYTCYGCHEHEPGEVARKHRKEGIEEFGDCASCHRSGDEDEAKRRRR